MTDDRQLLKTGFRHFKDGPFYHFIDFKNGAYRDFEVDLTN